jgi:serine/threonine-protein kinase
MAKKPDERYHSAGELAAAARRALNEVSGPASTVDTTHPLGGVPTRPSSQVLPAHSDAAPPPSRSKRKWLIASIVVLVVVVAGAALLLRNVLSPKATTELVLTAATDPGPNAFMPPAPVPPPTNTQPPR